jgi:nucleotide-binding universal stress UspA family protein
VEPRLERVLTVASFGANYGFVEVEQAQAHHDAEALLRRALVRADSDGEVRISDDEPAAALIHAASALEAELLAVGATGASGLRRLALGRVGEKVMRHAPCSVLVARGDGEQR